MATLKLFDHKGRTQVRGRLSSASREVPGTLLLTCVDEARLAESGKLVSTRSLVLLPISDVLQQIVFECQTTSPLRTQTTTSDDGVWSGVIEEDTQSLSTPLELGSGHVGLGLVPLHVGYDLLLLLNIRRVVELNLLLNGDFFRHRVLPGLLVKRVARSTVYRGL